MTPLVSVVCATYNRGPALRETLASVCAQTVRELELLVVSDGSTDDTDDVAAACAREDPRIHVARVPHAGHPSVAMNAGLEMARGEVIAYIDHDDRWQPRHLEIALSVLDGGADVAASGSTWVTPSGDVLSHRPDAAMLWHPELQVMFPVFENSQAVHRAGLLAEVGPWHTAPFGLEDWDMWLRLSDAGARFQTFTERTVLKTMTRTNRHRSLPQGHSVTLATFEDMFGARRALRHIMRPEPLARLAEAALEDMVAWYSALARTDEFVFPVGFAADRDEGRARLASALAEAQEADRGFEDPVAMLLVPTEGGVSLQRQISCMRAEHARRYDALQQRVLVRHQQVLHDLIDEASAVARN